jgi:hypothetical protein
MYKTTDASAPLIPSTVMHLSHRTKKKDVSPCLSDRERGRGGGGAIDTVSADRGGGEGEEDPKRTTAKNTGPHHLTTCVYETQATKYCTYMHSHVLM